MDEKQLTKFLESIKTDISNSDKIAEFIKWCNRYNLEEVILRLSSEKKGGISNNCFLDFTTRRLLVRNKRFLRKFLDIGYVAGLAPLPMVILRKDVNKKIIIDAVSLSRRLSSGIIDYYIKYSDIDEFIFSRGIDNTVMNMFGRMIVANYIVINTKDSYYKFTLPVNKNSRYESIYHWLQLVLPVKIKSM